MRLAVFGSWLGGNLIISQHLLLENLSTFETSQRLQSGPSHLRTAKLSDLIPNTLNHLEDSKPSDGPQPFTHCLPIQIQGRCEEKVGEERCLSTRFWHGNRELDGSQAAPTGGWHFQLWVCSWWWWFGVPPRHFRRLPQNLVAEALTKLMNETPMPLWNWIGHSCLSQNKACLGEGKCHQARLRTASRVKKKKQIAYKVDHLQCLGLDASAKSVDSRNYHVLQLGLWRKNLSCFHL